MLYHGTPEHAIHRVFVMSNLLLVLMPSSPDACGFSASTKITRTGSHINDIPRDVSSDVNYLILTNTNISILNLTATGYYQAMCRLEIASSPVKTIITPHPPQTVALTTFRLATGNFPTPPDLGIILAEQLEYLIFKAIGIVAIPDNYFQHYTSLFSLSLTGNPISDLNAGNQAELRNLEILYLANSGINSLAGLNLWLPNLRDLRAAGSHIAALSASMMENLPNLIKLDLSRNKLNTIPAQIHFVNLENMVSVKLEGNPLHCDSRLCWVKVIAMTMGYITAAIL